MERKPCQNRNSEECPVFNITGACFEDIHHEYWPRRYYRNNPVAKEFRELPENKTQMCRDEHNELHATQRPPKRPELDFMRSAIARSQDARRNGRRTA